MYPVVNEAENVSQQSGSVVRFAGTAGMGSYSMLYYIEDVKLGYFSDG